MIGDHLPLVATGVVGVIIGTRRGTRVLHDVSERRFGQIQKVALTALGIRLLVDALA